MDNVIEWITTIPGILIGSGVLLLIIALIIFILTSKPKKSKEEANLEPFNINNSQPEPMVNPVPTNFGINNPTENINRPFEHKPQMESSIKPLGIDNTLVMNPIPNVNNNIGANNINNNTINNVDTNINQPPVIPNPNPTVNEAAPSNIVPPVEVKPVVEVTPVVPITPIVEVTPVAEASAPNLSDVPGETFIKASEPEEIETLDF